jgi:hypothetical protein
LSSGIPYFPFDTSLDDKFKLIEAEFGLAGFGVVVKLYQKIYGTDGYYVEWTEEVALLFSKKIGLGGSAVSEIVRASIKRGIFDRDKFDKYSILTSRGIQKRYFEAVNRRKNVEVKSGYLLDDYTQIYKNVSIKRENDNISSENDNIFRQRKEEKTKEEKSKSIDDFFNALWDMYPRKEGKGSVSKTQKEKLYKLGLDKITRAIERYKAKLARDGTEPKYIKQGSTFFNSGYVDYLDENYKGSIEDQLKSGQPAVHQSFRIEIVDGQEVAVPDDR